MWDIRAERERDAEAIEALVDRCFGPGRYAKAAYRLREGVAPEPGLSFVAIKAQDGVLLGSVRFWPIVIGAEASLLLGPLAVEPELRGRGIGISLMQRGIDQARAVGFGTIILVGDEPYYARVGFSKLAPGRVRMPGPVDPDRSGQCSFHEVSGALGAELHETRDVNSEETLAFVRRLEPELVFVVGWSQLVRDPFIALAREGVFGMHPTLLPRHRGRAPIPWAILSGLARTGVTLFEIVDATADSGAIVGQVDVDIAPDETATTLFERLEAAHVDLVRGLVPLLLRREAPRISQDPRRASTWHKRVPADGIIDWETRAPYLDSWVRAQTRPYPGAFTWLGDEKVIVWRARPVELGERAPAGTIVSMPAEGPVVACGEGGLLLEEIETDALLSVGMQLG